MQDYTKNLKEKNHRNNMQKTGIADYLFLINFATCLARAIESNGGTALPISKFFILVEP